MKTRNLVIALGLMVAVPTGAALAQANATRTVRIIVPLQAGSSNDRTARTYAPVLAQLLGQPVVVENKAGGNGNIGTMEVVRAAADGLTLLLGSNSPMAANLAFMKNLPYDPRRDLTPIAGASLTNHVWMVKATHPAKTMAEFIAYAKARPGKVSVGSSTASVQTQIATLNKRAGIELLTVPYKGTPATFTDILGDVLDATLTDPGNALAQMKGGMRALAVSTAKRNPITPDLPAVAELYPGYDFPSWNALAGPANMPRDIVVRLSNAMMTAAKQAGVIEQLLAAGTTNLLIGADEMKAFIVTETDKWVKLAREANIQPE